jgi:hypothetical protein
VDRQARQGRLRRPGCARARPGTRPTRAARRVRARAAPGAARRRAGRRRRRAARAQEGAPIRIRVDGRLRAAEVRLRPFYDPDGERLRS